MGRSVRQCRYEIEYPALSPKLKQTKPMIEENNAQDTLCNVAQGYLRQCRHIAINFGGPSKLFRNLLYIRIMVAAEVDLVIRGVERTFHVSSEVIKCFFLRRPALQIFLDCLKSRRFRSISVTASPHNEHWFPNTVLEDSNLLLPVAVAQEPMKPSHIASLLPSNGLQCLKL